MEALLEAKPLSVGLKKSQMSVKEFELYDLFMATTRDKDRTAAKIRKQYQRAYTAELSTMLRLLGCTRPPALTDTLILKGIKDFGDNSAESITSTFNRNLANEVLRTDSSNKVKAIASLRAWRKNRLKFKRKQIDQWTLGSSIKAADKEFFERNKLLVDFSKMEAQLHPRFAKESICLGWIRRNWFPMVEAIDNAPPYHLNCPHFFKFRGGKMSAADRIRICPQLWVGGI